MQRRLVLGMFAAGLVFAMACDDDDDPAAPRPETYRSNLTGAQEKPNPVTSTATGPAEIVFADANTINFTVTVAGINSMTAGHFHAVNNANGTGPVVFGFFAGPATGAGFSGTVATGTITRTSTFTGIAGFNFDSLVARLRAGGTLYANLHTSAFPAGEIRGDMTKVQ
jgi:hypothetical protein